MPIDDERALGRPRVSGPTGRVSDPFVRSLFDPIQSAGQDVPSLWWSLATAPAMLRAWRGIAGVLTDECSTPASVRELSILRIAQLLECTYQWDHHLARAREAGVTIEQIDALERWSEGGCFNGAERAALAMTDALTLRARVPADVHAELAEHFDDPGIVELALNGGFYNCVCRVVGALYDG